MAITASEGFDHERALRCPRVVFGAPEEVLAHPGLDAGQRRAILEGWQLAAAWLAAAEGDDVGGDEEVMFQRVCAALAELDGPG